MSGKERRWAWELFQTIALALVLAVVIRAYVVITYRVDGPSMENTLHSGERLFVNRMVYRFRPPERGEIIVFSYPLDPSRDFIKRIVGLPGDRVEMRQGVVYINGEPLEEPYLSRRPPSNFPPVVVPENSVFVLGDNRGNSEDSRYFGAVPYELIKGPIFLRYWPLGSFRIIH
ncbi:MAG: signal peptidase I [Bacillota bacterium]